MIARIEGLHNPLTDGICWTFDASIFANEAINQQIIEKWPREIPQTKVRSARCDAQEFKSTTWTNSKLRQF